MSPLAGEKAPLELEGGEHIPVLGGGDGGHGNDHGEDKGELGHSGGCGRRAAEKGRRRAGEAGKWRKRCEGDEESKGNGAEAARRTAGCRGAAHDKRRCGRAKVWCGAEARRSTQRGGERKEEGRRLFFFFFFFFFLSPFSFRLHPPRAFPLHRLSPPFARHKFTSH